MAQDVHRYLAGKMLKQFSIPNTKFECQIAGRNEFDLFFPMKDGILHYNGTDMEYVFKFPELWMGIISDPLVFENDIFYSALQIPVTIQSSRILHGKLQ